MTDCYEFLRRDERREDALVLKVEVDPHDDRDSDQPPNDGASHRDALLIR
jgi:hypothetical protein